ncbi:hypothetical protein ACFLYU_02585 [Candidatus Dependentiae bacterium]
MAKSKVIISFLLASSFFLQAQEYYKSFPSKEHVKVKKEAIIRDYNFGKKIDYTIGGVASLLCVGLFYKFVKFILGNNVDKKVKALSNKQLTQKLLVLEEKFRKNKEPNIFGKGWFKGIGKSVFTSFVSSSLAAIGLKRFDVFYKRYHCFDNITQFISVRFEGLKMIDELLYNAQLVEHYKAEYPDKLQEVKDRFLVSLRNMIGAAENIIAFMEYKIDNFEAIVLTQEDILMPSYLFECLTSYVKKAELILENKFKEGLFLVSSEFKNDATRIIESFKGLEARIAWLS